jgi:hypothetical protein
MLRIQIQIHDALSAFRTLISVYRAGRVCATPRSDQKLKRIAAAFAACGGFMDQPNNGSRAKDPHFDQPRGPISLMAEEGGEKIFESQQRLCPAHDEEA